MAKRLFIDCMAIGQICYQTIATLEHKVYERVLAGPALYAVAGIKPFSSQVGLLGIIPASEKAEVFHLLEKNQIDPNGIIITTDFRLEEQFIGHLTQDNLPSDQPIPYFSALGMPLPLSLQVDSGVKKNQPLVQNFVPASLPAGYLSASAAHICMAPLEFQVKAATLVDKTSVSVFTILSDPAYMQPANWDMVMSLLNGVTAFISTIEQLQSLFKNRTGDIKEIGGFFNSRGCSYLITIEGAKGYHLFDAQSKKSYLIPKYPVRVIDPTGMDEAFCGGFLAGLRKTHDPVEAMLCGSVIASIKGEGCGPFYPLDTIPGLVDARINRLKDWVKFF
jgi:hypothetical protein